MHLSDPSTRYQGAWEEISQRLGVRAQLHVAHIAAVVALAGVYLQTMSTFVPKNPHDIPLIGLYAAASLLLISTMVVFLQRHNEGILGILSAFCRHFERHAKECGVLQPSWFDDSYQKLSLDLRRHSDRVTNSIVFVSPVVSFLQALTSYASKMNASENVIFIISAIFFGLSTIWACAMTYLIRSTPRLRSEYISLSYDPILGDIPVRDLKSKMHWDDAKIKRITGRSDADDARILNQRQSKT